MIKRKIAVGVTLAALLALLIGVVLLGRQGHRLEGAGLVLAGLTGLALLIWVWGRSHTGSRAALGRWARRNSRNAGTASWRDISRSSGRWAMRRRAGVVRPSLRYVPWHRLWRVPVTEYATPLVKVGRRTVWTSCEESTLRIGIPGTGKTAELGCRVLDSPGGVLCTSTATDLYELTAPARAKRGPVAVFNPGGLAGLANTLRWSPLAGCEDPAVAGVRATEMIGPGTGSAEGERWAVHARGGLALLLHAAALGGHRVERVHAWVANLDAHRTQILAALARSPQAAQMMQAAEQLIDITPRTRDGVTLAMAPALAWVTRPAAAEVGDPDHRDQMWTVEDLVDRRGTLYLLGDEDGTVAPLVAALTAEIVRQARQLAAARPSGRLDPGLSMVLDEVALICPVPLDRWMAELRKRSIAIHAACQGLGQLRSRWGENDASMILNAAQAVLVYGGCKDARDLKLFADLAGERDERTPVHDAAGTVTSTSVRRVPVIPTAMLAGLPNHRALLIRRGMPPAIARTPVAWKRREVRRPARIRATKPKTAPPATAPARAEAAATR